VGMLVNGVWTQQGYDMRKTGGAFVRSETTFRRWITADGSSGFRAEPGRYHLFVSLACPWASRVVIVRKLKKLQDAISMSTVYWGDEGWFGAGGDSFPETVKGSIRLHQVYTAAQPSYTGRVTVPVLWDHKQRTIVNNDSAEILRMLNGEFDAFGDPTVDFYPEELRPEIDRLNAFVYENVNDGVYRAGFATSQWAYEEAFERLFAALDELEARLARSRYLVGDRITEADWRLFTTLVRFDLVYYAHFKCNRRRLVDYRNLWAYTRDLYQVHGVAETVDLDHIKRHYYVSQDWINPTRIVPKGPEIDFAAPHGRDRIYSAPQSVLCERKTDDRRHRDRKRHP
jgi:glutathionyl-hydroquinone reductase